MSVKKMAQSTGTDDPFDTEFLEQRRNILVDIEDFLMMLLNYFSYIKQKYDITIDKIKPQKSLEDLIKSLCFLHGLYGYPAGTKECPAIREEAIKDIFEKINRTFSKEKNIFVEYCNEKINEEGFFTFKFDDEFTQFSPESLPREPAYYFLQLVQEMLRDGKKDVDMENLAEIGQQFLKTLDSTNKLKPKVCAHQENKQHINFGVSLGVPSFVRPLYLCIKLTKLSKGNVDQKCKFENVKAIKIQHKGANKNVFKDPCVSCQIMFGSGPSFFPLGNCAEYDVIGNVDHTGLLETKEWIDFKSTCEQHFDAFKNMIRQQKEQSKEKYKKILREYYNNTSNKQILRLRCNFELILQRWPPPKTTQ